MILTRFSGALAALGAWCVLATAAATPAFELPGVPAQARDSVGALFQTIDGGLAAPRADDVRASIGKGTIAVLYPDVELLQELRRVIVVHHPKNGEWLVRRPHDATTVEVGRTPASSALSMLSGGARARTLQATLNLRTASHAGVQLGERHPRGFEFVFPQP